MAGLFLVAVDMREFGPELGFLENTALYCLSPSPSPVASLERRQAGPGSGRMGGRRGTGGRERAISVTVGAGLGGGC